jgi:elongation factor Ts
MATITIEHVKELRDRTGVSVMQCRKALEEAGGDMDKAVIILRKKSGEISAKKADRKFGAGTVAAYVHATGNVGAMVMLSCETDFVAGNEEFKTLARNIAMHVTATNPKYTVREDITPVERATAKEVFENEMKKAEAEEVEKNKDSGKTAKSKPADVKAKILEGKLAAYFSEQVLLDQPFIKNPELTIGALISGAVQKFGEKIELTRFVRLGVGK